MAFYTWELGQLQSEMEGWEDAGLARVEWDESYTYLYALRDDIVKRFDEYYEYHEIGAETPWRWQKLCQRHYDANKAEWNHLIELYTVYDVNAVNRVNRITRDITATGSSNSVKDASTSSDTDRSVNIVTDMDASENSKTTSSQDVSASTTYADTTKEYDTPVTQTGSLNNGYLSGGTGTDSTTSSSEGTEYDNTIASTRSEDTKKDTTETIGRDDTLNETDTTSEKHDRSEVHEYDFYDKTPLELVRENASMFEDVIQNIVVSCRTLFINELTKV